MALILKKYLPLTILHVLSSILLLQTDLDFEINKLKMMGLQDGSGLDPKVITCDWGGEPPNWPPVRHSECDFCVSDNYISNLCHYFLLDGKELF